MTDKNTSFKSNTKSEAKKQSDMHIRVPVPNTPNIPGEPRLQLSGQIKTMGSPNEEIDQKVSKMNSMLNDINIVQQMSVSGNESSLGRSNDFKVSMKQMRNQIKEKVKMEMALVDKMNKINNKMTEIKEQDLSNQEHLSSFNLKRNTFKI